MADLSVGRRVVSPRKACSQAFGDALGLFLGRVPGHRVLFERRCVAPLKPDLHLGAPEHRWPLIRHWLRVNVQVPSIHYTGKRHA